MNAKLNQEEQELLEIMRQKRAERKAIPPEKRIPITNPGKYAFPIGIGPQNLAPAYVCPHCTGVVTADVIICPHCGADISDRAATSKLSH